MGAGTVFLLLLVLVVAVGFAVALYVTGGGIIAKKGTEDVDDGHRPEHKRPTNPTQEKVHFVGTDTDKEDRP